MPRLRADRAVDILPGDGVLLTDERGSRFLGGALFARLVPLIDGRSTADQIVERLADESASAVYYALLRLEAAGDIVQAEDRGNGAEVAGPVSVVAFGGAETTGWDSGLTELGFEIQSTGALTIVLTGDYQAPELEGFNRRALRDGQPWLLCRPTGTVLWIGPLFRPGHTACWECLRARLDRTRPIETLLTERRSIGSLLLPNTASSWTRQAAIGLVATKVAQFFAEGPPEEPTIVVLDTSSLSSTQHSVAQRVQCAACGDPGLYGERPGRRIQLQSCLKRFTEDGGHRAVTPEETITRLTPLVDRISGVIGEVRSLESARSPLHVYSAGLNLARPGLEWKSVLSGLRRSAGGKGWSDSVARAGAMAEAVERYSGVFQGDEPRVFARLETLLDEGIDPNGCLLFSDQQFRTPSSHPASHDPAPERFDPDQPVDWTPVWSLTEARRKYLPTAFLYYGYRHSGAPAFCSADSNGSAAGNTVEEACLQGLLELVERDSLAMWWYGKHRRPAVDLDSLDEPGWRELRNHYRELERELWVLDLTNDLGIPVYAAVSRKVNSESEELLLGLGAHLAPQIAFKRAVSELNQMLVFFEAGDRTTLGPTLDWWIREARVSTQPYLDPASHPNMDLSQGQDLSGPDLRDDVETCRKVIEDAGLEVLCLDQTRPDVEMPVVKMIAPGLRHARPNFAPGRLYDVPVALGWAGRPRSEDDLNPVPFIL
jgi:ribosomal protein S12 methylthiotransferase accessory factor